MKIEVLGSGCKKCKELYERTLKAVHSIGIDISVEYITDVQKIVEMGVMSSPVLAISGKPVLVGELPSVEKIVEIINNHFSGKSAEKQSKNGGCCSCGGKC